MLEVLHEDEHLVVLNKPSGMLVHRGWGRAPTVLVDLVRSQWRRAQVYPIQRLDRGTSGAVIIALDPETARALNERIGSGAIAKRYLALVRGTPPAAGTIDHPIPRRAGGPRVAALSTFRLLETVATEPRQTSLVEVSPQTGRLHQVRRHLKHLGHPVIGDANYGQGALNRAIAERYGLRRLALHAIFVGFEHPLTGQLIEIEAPLPADLAEPLQRLGFFQSSMR